MAGIEYYPTLHVIRRCISLLKRKTGSTATKQEYHYWIEWLQKQLINLNRLSQEDHQTIVKAIHKHKTLARDLKLNVP